MTKRERIWQEEKRDHRERKRIMRNIDNARKAGMRGMKLVGGGEMWAIDNDGKIWGTKS